MYVRLIPACTRRVHAPIALLARRRTHAAPAAAVAASDAMRVIGLTGGIACGKSLCTDTLRSLGIKVIDCDVIAKEVVEPGCWAHSRVFARFGHSAPKVFSQDGRIDRKVLGDLIFNDANRRRMLNAAMGALNQRSLLETWLETSGSLSVRAVQVCR